MTTEAFENYRSQGYNQSAAEIAGVRLLLFGFLLLAYALFRMGVGMI